MDATPLFAWAEFKLTTLLVIGTGCIGSYKSNYHTPTTTTVPKLLCHLICMKCLPLNVKQPTINHLIILYLCLKADLKLYNYDVVSECLFIKFLFYPVYVAFTQRFNNCTRCIYGVYKLKFRYTFTNHVFFIFYYSVFIRNYKVHNGTR